MKTQLHQATIDGTNRLLRWLWCNNAEQSPLQKPISFFNEHN